MDNRILDDTKAQHAITKSEDVQMIDRFHVRNFKALRDVALELTPIHVLIGPNDAGKTSILEALSALCRSVDYDFAEAFTGRWKGRELVWREEPAAAVEFDVEAHDETHRIHYALSVNFRPFPPEIRGANLKSESVQIGQYPGALSSKGNLGQNVGNLKNLRSSLVYASADHVLTEQDANQVETRGSDAQLVHDILSDVHVCRWDPIMLALPNALHETLRFHIDSSGFGLAHCLDNILGYDRKLFDELESNFRKYFPEIEQIRLLQEPAFYAPIDAKSPALEFEKREGKGIYFQLKNGGPNIPASQTSDGALLVLAYLTILHLPKRPRLLLVEEPENGIHPARLQEVLTILREIVAGQSHTQVVLTTHSPYVVSLFEPNEVTLCNKDDDGAVQTRRLSQSKAVREQIDVFTLGEIWTGETDERLMEPAQSSVESLP